MPIPLLELKLKIIQNYLNKGSPTPPTPENNIVTFENEIIQTFEGENIVDLSG